MLAGAAFLVAFTSVLGWWSNTPWLTHLGAADGTMKAAPSVAVACLAIGTLVAAPRRRRAPLVLGIAAALLGACSLLDDLVGIRLPLHDLLARLTPGVAARMSPLTAVELVLLGAALATLDLRFRLRRPSPWLSAIAGVVATLAIAGHIYDARSLYAVEGFATQSRPAAIAVLLVALSLLCARPRHGFMMLITGPSVASSSARRMLPLVLVPPLLSWLRLQGQSLGWYGLEFGVALVSVGSAVSLASLLLWSTTGLLRAERQRGRLLLEVEHQHRERRISARERQLAAILDAVPQGVIVRTATGQPFYRNAAASRILGREPDAHAGVEAAAQHYGLYVAGTRESYPLERLPMARALAGDASVVTDLEIEQDAGRIALQVHGTPVLDEHQRVAFGVATFVDVQDLRRQAFEDPLTGLANRAAILDAFTRLHSVCVRSHKPLSVAILDLDRFKSINDVHGHAIGDEVLRHVARCLASAVRDTDVVARWGGEEFVVLLPVADVTAARQTIERLLARVQQLVIDAPAGGFGVSFSAGVVEIGVREGDLLAAVERADRALYAAKAGGRARVEIAGELEGRLAG